MSDRRRILLALAGSSLLTVPPLRAQALPGTGTGTGKGVSFPVADPREDPRRVYPLQLLQLVLEQSGREPRVEERYHYTQLRAMAELRQGRLDVTMVTRRDLPASEGLVVPIPLRRGLLGLRLLLCRAERAQTLSQLRDLSELKALGLGYGIDWTDRPVFERLGFKVVSASNYAGLFGMLQARRSDYLSRGLNEIWEELANGKLVGPGLAVVPGLGLRYPLDDYFVVRPDAPGLAEALQLGLQNALRNGSYQRLFDEHFSQALRRAALHERRLLRVDGYPEDELVELAQQQLLAPLSGKVKKT